MAKVIILSGAGLSAQSGISTFRDSGGLWDNYDVSVVCNHDSLEKNENLTIEFYDKRRFDLKDKLPNKAHKVIADLKKRYKDDISIITQNVDNLFEKAGMHSDDVIHLHGFMTEVKCRSCEEIFDIGYKKLQEKNNGLCSKCGNKLRPNIVFFGEQAPLYELLNYHINDCELFIVIGTSGEVIGVNTIANFVKQSILNNLEPSSAIEDALFSTVIYDKATNAIDKIEKEIGSFFQN